MEDSLAKRAWLQLSALGMTPQARVKMGLDLVKTRDLALEMAELAEREDRDRG